ncbi:peptidase S8/S53 domain-containing protein [Biscogniauxia mediterranea]|nr:peptidase S8/S53 domain-containing protein [Biscogniauxia mediterranea]
MRGATTTTLFLQGGILLAGLAGLARAEYAAVEDIGAVIPNEYIVTLKAGVGLDAVTQHLEWLDGLLSSLTHNKTLLGGAARLDLDLNLGGAVARVLKRWSIGSWSAYAGVFDDATAALIGGLDIVDAVEPDREVSLADYDTAAPREVVQPAAPWGLGAICHRGHGELFDDYAYDARAGEGTFAYVLDSGVRVSHEEFEGRAEFGYDATDDEFHGDENGHGTHVAATIAGKTYGVAKKARIVAVKILQGPKARGKVSQMVDGIQWAVEDIRRRGRACVSVINISATTRYSTSLNRAVAAAAAAATSSDSDSNSNSILTVTAAGNCYANASAYSPASVPEALTVGAVGPSGARAQFSNYGEAVDVFAPGVGIVSAGAGSDTETQCLDGTSMAAPYVAGLALYLKSVAFERAETPEDTVGLIRELATEGGVSDTQGAPSLMVFNGHGERGFF